VSVKVHGGEWRPRDGADRCSYCGSISSAEAIRRLQTPGEHFSGTDKGPYKFYIGKDHGKFYGEHLDDLDPSELEVFARLSRKIFGMDVYRDQDGKTRFIYPRSGSFYGWQTWGDIGEDGKPVFGEGSPVPPPEEWFVRPGLPTRPDAMLEPPR